MLEYGDLEMGHARALLGMDGPDQITAAKEVVGKNMSVRQTEDLVRKLQSKKNEPAQEAKKADPVLKDLSDTLSSRFNSKVSISENAAGKGKITIAYENREKFEAILKALQ